MKYTHFLSAVLLFAIFAGLTGNISPLSGNEKTPIYKDVDRTMRVRVDDLLNRMTLEEKIGQMNVPCVFEGELGTGREEKVNNCRLFVRGKHPLGVGPGGGFFVLALEILRKGSRQQAEFINEMQHLAVNETRLGIPLLFIEEGTHGLMASGATIFPEGLCLGSTWSPSLVEKVYAAVAREARSIGVHALCTLVIEPNRDPRLGRNMECYSEDPYLISRLAESIVAGTQGHDVSNPEKTIAILAHYPGQSEPVSGHNRGAMEISERILREVYLPPWKAGITAAGALGVMATYPSIDGIPAHASKKIMTDILRNELQFDGILVGEGAGISTLMYERMVATQREAGILALRAGIDLGISFERGYLDYLKETVEDGNVPLAHIDRAVRRILRTKFRLGLFERPYVDVENAVRQVHSGSHRALSLQAAREGIVLLQNEGNILPLSKNLNRIAVIGPNADDWENQLGDHIAREVIHDGITVLEAIQNAVSPQTEISYVRGCNVLRTDFDEISIAAEAAAKADAAIVVVGENQRYKSGGRGTNGEFNDVASLDLTGLQKDLIKAVQTTGTPTIVVLINGRPLSIAWTAQYVPAIIEAWNCGELGGQAVAEIIFGDYNPDGHLPITIPRHVGQLPVYYNHKPSKLHWQNQRGYVDMPGTPLYHFGHGLSYTSFAYTNLRITPEESGPRNEFYVSVDVQNIGSRAGADVVQLYVNDVVSSVITPVKELQGFRKIWLDPGEKKTVSFVLTPDQIEFLDEHLEPVIEPGVFRVMIGGSVADIRCEGEFRVTG